MSYVRTAASLQREKVLTPPMSEGMELVVKFADNRAVTSRQDLFSQIRYVADADGQMATERDLRMGTLRIETIMLVLVRWNLSPAEGASTYTVTKENVLTLLSPSELDWLYTEIINMNPVWGGEEAGEA